MRKPKLEELTLREKIGQTAVAYCHCDYHEPEKKPWGAIYVKSTMHFKEFNARFDDVPDKGESYHDWIDLMENAGKTYKAPVLGVADNAVGLISSLPDFSKLTTLLLIGATDDEKLAYKAGYARGLQMKCAGVRWWWGPVVDKGAWKSPIGTTRQFSDDYDRIIRLAKAMIKGSMDAGVMACAKHFPGEDGLEYRDGHITSMVNYMTLEEWEQTQGRVYKELIEYGVPSIMIAHTAFPAVDPSVVDGSYRPSTISYPVITGLLKGKLGFKGAVVTDALGMRSLVAALGEDMKRVYIEAFKAGNDFMLGCEDYYVDCIEEAVKSGEISMERVDDACSRALALKEKIGMFEDGFTIAEGDFDEVKAYCDECNREIAMKGIGLVCDRTGLLPVKKENIKRVALVYFCPYQSVRKEYAAVKEAFEARGAEVKIYETITSWENMRDISKNSDLIVYLAHYGVNATFVDPEYRAFYYALLYGAEKSVVINTGDHTVYYEFFTRFPTFVNAYTAEKTVLETAVSKLYGESDFTGILPFSIYPPKVVEFMKDKPYKLL